MSGPFVGEIRLFAGSFEPTGWMFCRGQLLPISENDVLFQLIGTTYGGDGQSTFALPDLQGRVPLHQGQGSGLSFYTMGETGGVETVTLTTNQIPAHTHAFVATRSGGTSSNAIGNVLASSPNVTELIADTPSATMPASSIGATGGSQPHDNMAPTIAINYIISLFGVFPSQT
ncbi:MAG: Tail Collar domain protein [Frankiales bacterium]|jgi:microcystin-dependent protein|nr:Tail Collar domain protein [Frankiales bacterium]